MFRLSVSIIATTFALASFGNAGPAETIRTFDKRGSIAVVADLQLSPLQRAGLREFRGMKAYFGAYYVSKDGNAYQHFVNWHDLNEVKKAARKGCEIVSEGNPCTLAAVSVPKGVDPNGTEVSGLGSWARRDFGTYQAKQVASGFGAFAVSGSAHQGYAHNWQNEAEARGAALAYCEAAVARDMTTIENEGRAFARANGYNKCRVIDVTLATE